MKLTADSRRDDRASAIVGFVVFFMFAFYASVTVLGILGLESSEEQVGDPYFSIMETTILILCPLLCVFFARLVTRKNGGRKASGLVSIVFLACMIASTSAVHFLVLTVSRPLSFCDPSFSRLFSFTWPSVVYSVDILAWDVFFPLSCIFLMPSIPRNGLAGKAGISFWVSGAALSFAGLIGVPLGNMQVRLVGVLGYAFLIPVAILLTSVALYGSKESGT